MVTLFWFKSFCCCCWGGGGFLELDLKEKNFVLFFFDAAQKMLEDFNACLPTTSVLFVTIVVGAIVAHTCFALSEFLAEFPTRDMRSLSHETMEYSSYIWIVANFFNLVFHFWNIWCVSTLICYFSCPILVSEIWSSSGPHRNWASQEVEGLRRESMCISIHVEREREREIRESTTDRNGKKEWRKSLNGVAVLNS